MAEHSDPHKDAVIRKYVRVIDGLSTIEAAAASSNMPIPDSSYIEFDPPTAGVPSRGLHIDFRTLKLDEVYKLKEGDRIPFDDQYRLVNEPNAIKMRMEVIGGEVPLDARLEAVRTVRDTLERAMAFLARNDPWQRLV